ncbi:MAG: hypothetical protein D6761_07815 [Candidatus Dadabacteria bacterium]|nr:MAG: hypothetical protein D6761_07815 [Candidatus Dadabacteria bacterium]
MLELDQYDPLAPASRSHYEYIRRWFETPTDAEHLVRALWQSYSDSGRFDHGHWALMYSQLWWQGLPAGEQRLRVSRIGRAMALKLMQAHPEHAAGPFWSAAFLGFDALVRGVLDSLNMIPEFFKLLDEAERRDPEYLLGTVWLAKAKAYIKLPPFPMSIGSVKKGVAYLEKARPLQEPAYGLWHITRAEAELATSGEAAALKALDGLSNVCPPDMQSIYTYEISAWFAGKFRNVVANGTYNKYTWDPMLESALPLLSQPANIPACVR